VKDPQKRTADVWRVALQTGSLGGVESTLAAEVHFGSCVGKPQVVAHLSRILHRIRVSSVDVEALPDRLIATLEATESGADMPSSARRTHTVVGFVQDGLVVELQAAADREEARQAAASAKPPPRPEKLARLSSLAAVLAVRDLGAALEHYRQLGFTVRAYEGGGYGFIERDDLQLHLGLVSDLDPATTTSAVYLYVDDADRLYAEWRSAGVSGQFFAPVDTEYGLREGAHVDLDGNLLRFGSRRSGQ
jgi:hypothetical protein